MTRVHRPGAQPAGNPRRRKSTCASRQSPSRWQLWRARPGGGACSAARPRATRKPRVTARRRSSRGPVRGQHRPVRVPFARQARHADVLSNFIPGEDPPQARTTTRSRRRRGTTSTSTATATGSRTSRTTSSSNGRTGPYFLGDTVQPYTVTRVATARRPSSREARRRPTTSARARRRITTRSPRRRSRRSQAAARCSPASVTIRSSPTSATSSTCSRSARAPAATGGGKDFLAGYAVHTIALQIPISQLDTASHTIGTGRRRPPAGQTKDGQGRTTAWVQVSRLGNPLINEVVIPTV